MQIQKLNISPRVTNDLAPLPEAEFQRIKVQDFAENGETLINDITAVGIAHNVSLGRVLEHMVELSTEANDESDPDVVVDILERRGHKLKSDQNGPSTLTARLIDNRADRLLLLEYERNQYFYTIHNPAFWRVGAAAGPAPQGDRHPQFASNTRQALAQDAFNRSTLGMVEESRSRVLDLELADVIGSRNELMGNQFTAPILKEPTDYKLTNIGEGAEIPQFNMSTGDEVTKTGKAGYAIPATYEVLRGNNLTIEAMSRFSMRLAYKTTVEMVNQALDMIANNATVFAVGATTFDTKGVIKTNLQARKVDKTITYDTIVATEGFLVEYAAVDFSHRSDRDAPMTPRRRTFLDRIIGDQTIAWRDKTQVPKLVDGTNDVGLMYDRRYCLEYLFERNSNIEEMDRDESIQVVTFYRTFSYAFRLMEMSENARQIASLKTS